MVRELLTETMPPPPGISGGGPITADRALFERGKTVHDRIKLLAGIDPH